jgi:hypothetical protein
MKRGVNRSCDAILTESAKRVISNHLVFMGFAAIDGFEFLQAIEVKQSETGFCDRSQVTAASLYGQDAHGPARERIGKLDLGARVAAPKIGNSQVGSQKIRAVSQQRKRVGAKSFRRGRVPEVCEMGNVRGLRHK